MTRNTATRNRLRANVARGKPPCHICGEDIDYQLPHMDPGEFVIDHIIPVARGGTDTADNVAAAHRRCNLIRGTKMMKVTPEEEPAKPAPRTYVTWRTW
ncbi:HNH endonuclease [Nocardia anaemiae]|uniref:HNH endonuclease n=1 Tax=Nocardia anaemiae TaxID=263910 RepID=UPI0007C86B6A|nr:HNH endonuclease signature motif containing protein [Nocardia anaemiae]